MERNPFNPYQRFFETLGFFFPVAVILAMVAGALAVVLYVIPSAACTESGERMKLPSEYRMLSGCMLKTAKGWRSDKAIRELDP